jgi:YHS domain-containing protein
MRQLLPHSIAKEEMYMSTDPVCGMEVHENTAPAIDHDGKTYYFCSRACLGAFQDHPEMYVEATHPTQLREAA